MLRRRRVLPREGLPVSLSSKRARRLYRRTVRRDRVTLILRVSDTPHRESVYVDVEGSEQEAWADHDGCLLGSTWESYGNGRIWNMLSNHPGIVDELKVEGYVVDASEWSEPEEMPAQLPLPGEPCPVCGSATCQELEAYREA